MTAQQPPAPSPAIRLSPESEARVVFWSAPPDSIHPARVVAEALEVAINTLANWRSTGEGPRSIRRAGRAYYRKRDVVEWMERA